MKTKLKYFVFVILVLSILKPEKLNAQTEIDIESGLVATGYNDVRIPGNNGTFFSLKDDLSADPAFFLRARISYTIKTRHTLSLLYAPLKVTSAGSVPEDILFEGEEFTGDTELKGVYKFNSYRLTYRYLLVSKPKLEFGLGFTAKIRDASISLESADLTSVKTNVGFVPIINFRLLWKPDDRFGLLLDGDALAAKQGRAEDVLLAATYKVSENIGLRAGYRLLEGGADNDEVYNFALFHYASVGLSLRF
ncbi:MAG: hypothetical protein JXR66_02720 [Bacteroidales bacterium]|nr:hypothetical protein [Bacteroidales bacterium]MBN2632441.1 hypothetical protein [Bacteroidales bacterium]